MDLRDYYVILYDYYSELLTLKQRDYFENYYFNNLSLSEISENMKLSRNAVHKCIKLVEKKLLFYEEKLSLYDKSLKLRKIIDEIEDSDIKNKLNELI